MATKRETLNVSKKVYKNLENRKHEGQSFDGVIRELLKEVES